MWNVNSKACRPVQHVQRNPLSKYMYNYVNKCPSNFSETVEGLDSGCSYTTWGSEGKHGKHIFTYMRILSFVNVDMNFGFCVRSTLGSIWQNLLSIYLVRMLWMDWITQSVLHSDTVHSVVHSRNTSHSHFVSLIQFWSFSFR